MTAAGVTGTVDEIGLFSTALSTPDNIKTFVGNTAPVVEIPEFIACGPVLAVRPFCENVHYWQAYFDTNRTIREAFGEAGFPAPELSYGVSGRE